MGRKSLLGIFDDRFVAADPSASLSQNPKLQNSGMNILVVGLGNILLRDEGVGVRLVERLGKHFELPSEVEALDGGTSGMDLIHIIADRDALIVCDAVRSDKPPGSVLRIAGEELRAFFCTRLSPHQLGLSDVLAALTLLEQVPPRITLIGIVPQDLGLGTELSPRIEVALDEALALLAAEIESLGFHLRLSCSGCGENAGVPTA